MHWVSGSNHSSGKSTPMLCIVFLKMGLLSVWLSLSLPPSFPLFLSLSDNSSRLSNCVFEWSYTAGWNLQSDTENTFLSLSLSVSPFILCLSSLASPHPALPPAMRFLQALLNHHPLFFFPTHSQWGLGSITAVRRAVIDVIISIWADYSWELLIVWPGVE